MKISRLYITVGLMCAVTALAAGAPADAKLIAAIPQTTETQATPAPPQPAPADPKPADAKPGETASSSGDNAAAASTCPEIKRGDFGGIGASLHEVEGAGVSVLHAIEGLPADKAGLRIGDKLIAVDGKPVAGMQMCELIALIRGPAGSVVNMTIRHIRDDAPVTIPVTRELIQGH